MGIRNTAVYREKIYICGNYADVYIYPVYPNILRPSGRRRSRRAPTRAVQEKLNRRHRAEKLARLMNTNFTERDLAVTLTYAINPDSDEVATKDIQKWLRRVRYRYKKAGITLKYIWTMERSGKGRYHFHVVLSGGVDRDELEMLWGHGYANTKRLQFDEQGLTALSRYMTKSVKDEDRTVYRTYNPSKNLIDPEPTYNDSKIRSRKRAAELADEDWNAWRELYPEYEVADLWPFTSDEYGSVYIFARLRRLKGRDSSERKRNGRADPGSLSKTGRPAGGNCAGPASAAGGKH